MDDLSRYIHDVDDAIRTAGARIAHTAEEVGLCAFRQAEQNASRYFHTMSALQGSRGPGAFVDICSDTAIRAIEVRTVQIDELREVITTAMNYKP